MMDEADSLLRQVDQDVRDERIAALWRQYRTPVMVAIAAIIVGTIGNAQWHNYREKQAGVAMQEISAAQQLFAQQKYDEATTAFATVASQHPGNELTDVAHLWQARSLLAAKKTPEGIAALTDLAEHPQSGQHLWRDEACLRLVALDASKTACLAVSDDSPLAAQRKLTHAALLWQQQKPAEAQALLEALVDSSETSPAVRESAKRYLSVLAPAKPATAVIGK